MPKFRVQNENGTFEVEAADENQAAQAVTQMHADPNANLKYGEVPEGMVYDPQTKRMVDAGAIAQQLPSKLPFSAGQGMPFVGQWMDELVGMGDPVKTQVAREAAKQFDAEHPIGSTAAKLAVGATAIPALVASGGLVGGLASKAGPIAEGALGGLTGVVGGGAEGYASGYGSGETSDERSANANQGAAIGAGIGGVIGAAAPSVSKLIGKGVNSAFDAMTVNRQAAALGVGRPSVDAVTRSMAADDVLGPIGGKNIIRAGDDAMLADAGGSARQLLDTAIQKSGPGARIASLAVQQRAAKAGQRLSGVMDMALGRAEGLNKAARDIASDSAPARTQAYKAAYETPIDYASDAGRNIEDVVSRVPSSILKPAINEANDSMKALGIKNMQIMADIADNGSITFKQMPNVQQLDELKKALGKVAADNVDNFGRKTAPGIRADQLAKQLRNAVSDAVPGYGKAVQLGGDKIAEDNALRLGANLLRPSTTREEVRDAVDGITEAEQKRLALGLRQHIDEQMANVTQAISDPNIDAREAAKALKDLSSRAAREKVSMAIGDQRAKVLFNELERTQAAIGLKASVADNSKTFARTAMDESVKAATGADGLTYALRRGEPLNAGKRLIQSATGATDQAAQDAQQKIYEDIASLLTGPRGDDALTSLQSLLKIYRQVPQNAATAQGVGRAATGAAAAPAYQTLTGLGGDSLRPQRK